MKRWPTGRELPPDALATGALRTSAMPATKAPTIGASLAASASSAKAEGEGQREGDERAGRARDALDGGEQRRRDPQADDAAEHEEERPPRR